MPLTAAEQRVCEAIEAGRDQLVGLASDLIGFDTTARRVGDPCRDEVALQEYLAGGSVPPGRRWTCGSQMPLRWRGCRWSRPGFRLRGGRS